MVTDKYEVVIECHSEAEAQLIALLLHTYLKEHGGVHRDFVWRERQ